MRTQLEISTRRPEELKKELNPSLDSSKKVQYSINTDTKKTIVEINADGLGSLRGSADNVFRLISVSNKIKEL